MAGTWALFRAIAKKKLTWGSSTVEKPRIDRDLPLGIRVGSMLSILSVDSILAGDQLKIKMPTKDLMVVAYGKFFISPFTGYRFYLSADSGELFTLQVVLDAKGKVDDCKLFALHDEIITNDWDFWINERDGYIGYSVFQLKPEPDGTPGMTYFRAWDNQSEEIILEQNGNDTLTHIPPVEFAETVYGDPFGNEVRKVKHTSMLYGRDVTDTVAEYMMASVAEDSDGASIQILLGLPLEPASVKVLF
jgi:hypothetical protein